LIHFIIVSPFLHDLYLEANDLCPYYQHKKTLPGLFVDLSDVQTITYVIQGNDILQRQISRKRYNIQLYLQWQTDESKRSIEWCHVQWSGNWNNRL